MLAFAVSDSGGAGRSVTSANLAYRCALQGMDVCYADFDFGSPTVGTVFGLAKVAYDGWRDGTHSYLMGRAPAPSLIDVWAESDRRDLKLRPESSGRLTLQPGDPGGGEFSLSDETASRCEDLFRSLDAQFDVVLVDLPAGRSFTTELAIRTTAAAGLRNVVCRWLVFHRWTYQQVIAASDLVHGHRGLVRTAAGHGHCPDEFADSVRFVRVAVVDPDVPALSGISAIQASWLRACDQELRQLSAQLRMGASLVLGSTPFDPVLQAREQLIVDADVDVKRIANAETVSAFEHLAQRLNDGTVWSGL